MSEEGKAGVSFSEFARLRDFKPSYVTQLKGEGRLVLTPDGKRVLVAESVARIAATQDPSKAGVAARHAAHRGEGAGTGAAGATPAPQAPVAAPVAPPEPAAGGQGYQQARAVNEKFKALTAKLEYEARTGKLLDAAQVENALSVVLITLFSRLEALAANNAPRLAAETDERAIRELLAREIEDYRLDVTREFERIAKTPTQVPTA